MDKVPIVDISHRGIKTGSEASKHLKNCYTNFPKSGASMSGREKPSKVDARHNDLTEIDTKDIYAIDTTSIDLRVNKLTQCPDFRDFPVLVELYLSSNRIQQLELSWMPQSLEVLIVNHNRLDRIPNLQKLPRLKTFEASYNHITTVLGLPESIEKVELKENPLVYLALDCFPKPRTYEIVRGAISDRQVMALEEPPSKVFNEGYKAVKSYYIKLKVMRRKLNSIFTKKKCIKVQSMYMDESWYKVIVNVKAEGAKEIHELLAKKLLRKHVKIVEQPNSPRLLSRKISSGSQIEITHHNNVHINGTIAGKVIDDKNDIYLLTCKHLFSKVVGEPPQSVLGITACEHDLGTDYLGHFGSDEVSGFDDKVWIDTALVKVTDETVLKAINEFIYRNNGELQQYREDSGITLKGCTVQKYGSNTELTQGEILEDDFMFFLRNGDDLESGSETLLIHVPKQGNRRTVIEEEESTRIFSTDGDSGSLITTTTDAQTQNASRDVVGNHALGMCFAVQEGFVHVDRSKDEETTISATFGVKLHVNFAALEAKHDLKGLRLCGCKST